MADLRGTSAALLMFLASVTVLAALIAAGPASPAADSASAGHEDAKTKPLSHIERRNLPLSPDPVKIFERLSQYPHSPDDGALRGQVRALFAVKQATTRTQRVAASMGEIRGTTKETGNSQRVESHLILQQRARRRLFSSPTDQEKLGLMLMTAMRTIAAKKQETWNFDFEAGEPLPGHFQWSTVSHDDALLSDGESDCSSGSEASPTPGKAVKAEEKTPRMVRQTSMQDFIRTRKNITLSADAKSKRKSFPDDESGSGTPPSKRGKIIPLGTAK
ncbi:hypothetical protein BV898_16235 [Hypsibius exemplaris]|uniref:Cyclin-dependent kinase inhibitor domain-containing protein n=1 Tax=Hypsibius exemplaris TaxID=2072580 RepID=A0A9X6NCY1_HYPEX|nr:hypothetical protein BV898_16235 [Hypsibius exemplaris]